MELYFHGVADRCDVYLNGKRISSHQGMFGGPKVDVTDSIKIGQNELAVVLKLILHGNRQLCSTVLTDALFDNTSDGYLELCLNFDLPMLNSILHS